MREAGAEALALVARGMAELGLGPGSASGAGAGAGPGAVPPVMKVITDCLSEGKKEVQAAACTTLALVCMCVQ